MSKQSNRAAKFPQAPLGAVLRVRDISEASTFYQKLGFIEKFALPDATGKLIVAYLQFGASTLMLGTLLESHYDNPDRLTKIQHNERGLGVVITLTVKDIDHVHRIVKSDNCEILMEPTQEFYGDEVFMFLDPFGYEWKISMPSKKVTMKDIREATSQIEL